MSRPRRMDEAAPVEGVSQLVERFNQCGLAVLVIAQGRGRKPTYDLQARERVVQEVQRQPDRLLDQTAIWSRLKKAMNETANGWIRW